MYKDKVSEVKNAFDIGPSVKQTITVSRWFFLSLLFHCGKFENLIITMIKMQIIMIMKIIIWIIIIIMTRRLLLLSLVNSAHIRDSSITSWLPQMPSLATWVIFHSKWKLLQECFTFTTVPPVIGKTKSCYLRSQPISCKTRATWSITIPRQTFSISPHKRAHAWLVVFKSRWLERLTVGKLSIATAPLKPVWTCFYILGKEQRSQSYRICRGYNWGSI